ncbi:anthranilate phosphoribosyltransferase [Aggregatibacter actinomycetemcomitans]|uniref:anthranilate phosphoribosyltransferase n=1 Tax=Aggregatibacter actinomycetemcomitans TaxID=714 RepID=UPI0011DAB4F3|nr:anthranilate phosphoribosyltransferase [Aggregatibacter actinomycetemcomitans]QEH49429.1 anthranilate phosphoribosyltransferase [Aggregatibacter actinomycetemcomitans]TYA50687.1 anthranilate phosphoribosyltransferase [Aggregatibacter actinomycetemcomitans]TYB28820.1 anthranilate phosphoribosyltransferase [Aggregatibacter actinomycetemcomitans]
MESQALLEKLYGGHTLTAAESEILFNAIMSDALSNEQIAAMLIALKVRGETIDEVNGAVLAAMKNTKPFPTPDYPFADIVGTGGDGANTINISTASTIVAASCGAKVAKHGNRSVSGKTGSSDLLTALGVNIAMSPEQARKALDDISICFLFAQQYHPGFKYVVPVRQALKTRTLFNILGPLINPARPKRQLLGVYSPELIEVYAKTIAQLGHEHTIIVHGSGLDEVAIHGITQVAEVHNGNIERYTLTPQDFGFQAKPLETLRGGEPAENAQMITALLQGNGKAEHNQAVAMNTALLLKLFGQDDLKHNAQQVLDVIAQGKPFETLQKLTAY